MNLPDTLLDDSWYWMAWAIWSGVVFHCVRTAPWKRLLANEQSHLWLGMIALLVLIWSLKAGVKPGLSLHLLGATAFTLSCGPQLAFLGLSLVLAGITLNGAAGWFGFALNALLMGGVGVFTSFIIYCGVDRYLPRNFFIYIFINGFFGGGLTLLVVGAAACTVYGLSGVYGVEYLVTEYLPYFLLLGFSEAWITGMVMTLFVIYRPDWVITFDDSRYLANK